ncbi:MAG TPA: SRPBCC family protein [Azospirillum sp.]|nr:SRPBCC family protein [Azospirillum sp.]
MTIETLARQVVDAPVRALRRSDLGAEPHDDVAGPAERWAAIMGGTALGLAGLRRGDWIGMTLVALSGGLLFAGATGLPMARRVRELEASHAVRLVPALEGEPASVQANITIYAPREKVFRFWRNFGNLPKLMGHLDVVEIESATRSCWKARGPGGVVVRWHAEIDKEQENELISWHTLEDADLPHRGQVRLHEAPGGRGTEVRLTLVYRPPGGQAGRAVARLFGSAPGQQAREALRKLKYLLEVGELPTIEGQPHGRSGIMKVTP